MPCFVSVPVLALPVELAGCFARALVHASKHPGCRRVRCEENQPNVVSKPHLFVTTFVFEKS